MIWQIDTQRAAPVQLALPDVAAFLSVLNAQADFFDEREPLLVARAPGRLDLMGGIADYSGSLVLQWPLAVATFVAVQCSADAALTVRSTTAIAIGAVPQVTLPVDVFHAEDGPLTYEDARLRFTADEARSWVAYVAGVLLVLQHERDLRLETGLRILIHSDVPLGKGVSSSASLEVATMQAVCGALNMQLDGRTMALLCQVAENRVVGAPCGVMDQMAAACGEQQHLLALRCQPAEVEPLVQVPSEFTLWGIDSGVRHAVSGSDYRGVRIGAFMGYRILADLAGLPVAAMGDGAVRVADDRWGGYLANVTPDEWETMFRDAIPEHLDGATFLQRYGGTTDPVTRVDPLTTYAVRQPTAHPIYEHARVQRFRDILQNNNLHDAALCELGKLMYRSHASYTACGLGTPQTDRLVDLVQAVGAEAGLYGAKITGGGSGGTVAVFARWGMDALVSDVAARYAAAEGRVAIVLGGSSLGAIQFGLLHCNCTA